MKVQGKETSIFKKMIKLLLFEVTAPVSTVPPVSPPKQKTAPWLPFYAFSNVKESNTSFDRI
jgi:hypothetical protein